MHEYGRVSLNLVWAIVQNNLPPLKVTVQQILQELLET
ncbi:MULTISPECIES: HepT-like ribonuclease domain-containing protein [unclassified Microcoleus]